MAKWKLCLLAIGILTIPKSPAAWTEPINISNTSEPSNWPAITVDDQERVHVVWSEDYFRIGKIFYTYCDGDAWSSPIDISRNDLPRPLYTPTVQVDSLGNCHVMWTDNESEIMWTYCNGDTWSIPANISNTPGGSTGPRTAIDDSGGVHVVWHDNSTGNVEIYYTVYDNESWQESQRITDSPGEEDSSWPDIEVDSKGHPHVVWTHYGGTGSSSDYWTQYSTHDGVAWSTPVDILKIEGKHMSRPKIATDSQDHPHVVAEWWSYKAIYYTRCDGTDWTLPFLVCEERHAGRPDIAVNAGSEIGCVVWGDRYYRFFQNTQWDSIGVIDGPGGILPALSVGASTFHLVWTAGDIYYSRHRLTAVESQEECSPRQFRLNWNCPNPFSGKTTIPYEIPEDSYVTLIISDNLGRIVQEIDLGFKQAGHHVVPIFVDSSRKGGAHAGIYFYTIKAGNFIATRKMVVIH